MNLVEIQIDRIVGPTHHFGGLGVGNVASRSHAGEASNPAAGARQGLDKMRLIAELGVPQFVLPPQMRPSFDLLRTVGFGGTDADVLKRAYDEAPGMLSASMSGSATWTANAATATPGVDSGTDFTTLTVANLVASMHRAIEPVQAVRDLTTMLPDRCIVQPPLPGGTAMRDEGAANHMRLGSNKAECGINVFVFGDGNPSPAIHWPRQTRAASEAVARLHKLPEDHTFYFKQHPEAIDAGAFHNDVVAMSHHNLLIHHELAFYEDESSYQDLERQFEQITGTPIRRISIPAKSLSIDDAVRTYLFNSQIVSSGIGRPVIVCPSQVQEHARARNIVDGFCDDGVFEQAKYVDLRQSMSGGGGPACLRLRVPLLEQDVSGCRPSACWTDEMDGQLRETIERYYVTRLTLEDLADIEFVQHAIDATRRVAKVLGVDFTG